MFIIYLVKFSFFIFFLFATDCVFSVNKDYHMQSHGINVAITMHCNLRPQDVAPSSSAFTPMPTRFKVDQPIRCHLIAFFTVDTLRYVVTLTFDRAILIFKL